MQEVLALCFGFLMSLPVFVMYAAVLLLVSLVLGSTVVGLVRWYGRGGGLLELL